MGEAAKFDDRIKDVVLKIENINEIILDATAAGDQYQVFYDRLDDWYFEQTVIGEGICECCGAELNDCQCQKEKAVVIENVLCDYINNLFNTEENIILIIDGTKYRKR